MSEENRNNQQAESLERLYLKAETTDTYRFPWRRKLGCFAVAVVMLSVICFLFAFFIFGSQLPTVTSTAKPIIIIIGSLLLWLALLAVYTINAVRPRRWRTPQHLVLGFMAFALLIIYMGCLVIAQMLQLQDTADALLLACIGIGSVVLLSWFFGKLPAALYRWISKQHATILFIRREWHRAWLFDIASPFVRSRNRLRETYDYWRRIISVRNRTFLWISAIALGICFAVFMYHVANVLDPEVKALDPESYNLGQYILVVTQTLTDDWKLEPLQLVLIGFIASIVLLFVAELGYNSWGRSRYVFGEFSPLIATDQELGKIAEDLRRSVITELQLTAGLLKQRQVENFNLSQEDSNAFFVSSGFDQEFLEKIEDIVSIDVPTGRINLAQLSLLYARSTAKVFATGRVTRQQAGGVEIRVEMRHWRRSPINAYARIDALVAHETIDSHRIQLAAREIALKLLLDLNQVTGIGSSWHTFDAFLKGLKAASTQHWWQAISYYNQALDTGPSEPHDRFGVIYFHLGSALIFQGSWESGMELLRKAEEYGPPIPETHYMLAFGLLYAYWGKIADYNGIFQQIEFHCRRAIALRPEFPEAYHLLGTANYRRGRIIERKTGKKGDIEKNSLSYYTDATRAYRRALAFYDDKILRLSRDVKVGSHVGHALLLQRMTVEHQLADSQRGIAHWFEAEQHYKNMQLLFPANLRNIADLLKTYCMAEQWEYGKLVLYRSFLDVALARWDADVLVHAGWLLAKIALQYKAQGDNDRYLDAVAEATMYLDFTLLMRPRYIDIWTQTNWQDPFKAATETSLNARRHPANDVKTLMGTVGWYRYWIDERTKSIEGFKAGDATSPPWLPSTLQPYYGTFVRRIHTVARQEESALDNVRDTGLSRRFERIDAAAELHMLWQKFDEWAAANTQKPKSLPLVTGKNRLTMDMYVQVTLFTARMLAEAGMYDNLITVAEVACQRLTDFHSLWTFTTNPEKSDKAPILTPLVYRYGFVSVRAWYAYAVLAAKQDFVTRSMQPITGKNVVDDYALRMNRLAKARQHLAEAKRYISVHPLLLFVQAQYAAHDGLYAEAIDGMKTVLNIVAPIDPKRDVGGSIATPQPPTPSTSDDRSNLYFLERIIGRQQFHNIVNPVSIHLEIARYAAAMNDIERAVRHQSEAVRSSPFSDTHRDILLELAQNLSAMERYGDANAVIDTLRTTRAKIGHIALSAAKQFAPEVLDAVVTTRRGRQAEALAKAQNAAQHLEYVSIEMLIARVEKMHFSSPQFVSAFIEHARTVNRLIANQQVTLENDEKTASKFARVFPRKKVRVGGKTLWELQRSVIDHVMRMPEFQTVQRKDIQLPLVFGMLEDLKDGLEPAMNTLTSLAQLSQSRAAMHKLYDSWRLDSTAGKPTNADKMQFMQVALFLGRQARDFLFHMADLCNALAYNRATMQNGFSYYASIDVRTALNIMLFLREITDPDHETYNDLVRRLAQYCDTLGWVEFARLLPTPRNGLAVNGVSKDYAQLLKGLQAATEYLELGVHYDPSRAIIHYHLAHIHLRAVELLQEENSLGSRISAIAKAYLEHAKTELEVAERNDPHGRLRDPIRDAILWYRQLSASFVRPSDNMKVEPRSTPLNRNIER